MENLQYWHWVVVGAGFGVWSLLSRISWLKGPCLGGLLVGLMTYLIGDMHWAWQLWVFIMISVLAAIVYLRMDNPGSSHSEQEVSSEAVLAASEMAGKWAILQEDLLAGHGKIPIEGRYWQVETKTTVPAGSRVLVTGHKGGVLQLRQEQHPVVSLSRGEGGTTAAGVLLADYQRSAEAEVLFGSPDMDFWVLFKEALRDNSKLSLIYAYHLICGLRGIDLEHARRRLNTYTLGLYDGNRPGRLMPLQPRIYSEPKVYGFLYGSGRWRGRQLDRFHHEMDALEAALQTEWAEVFRDTVSAGEVAEALLQIRLRQVSVS